MGLLWDVFRIGTSLTVMAISAAYYKKRDMPNSAEVIEVIDGSIELITELVERVRGF
ncbi:unannotated protein [freshwater metagenome]|jgi:hypothetical protein|uniref:Unannotated protein n=1 Tax=freshwater metagenome TaxID=449393 RepID=A0A6J6EVY3_9ZZZZ